MRESFLLRKKFLLEKFGESFTKWTDRTPSIIPAFFRYRRASQKFDWKKAINKEKSGLLAIISIFSTYEMLGLIINARHELNHFLLIAFIVSALLYAAIKMLKIFTSIFRES